MRIGECIHATRMRGDESERSVASVAVRVTSERVRMHERDGKRNDYLFVVIAATCLGIPDWAHLGSNQKTSVRSSHPPVSTCDIVSQVEETTGGRGGQTWLTLIRPPIHPLPVDCFENQSPVSIGFLPAPWRKPPR